MLVRGLRVLRTRVTSPDGASEKPDEECHGARDRMPAWIVDVRKSLTESKGWFVEALYRDVGAEG